MDRTTDAGPNRKASIKETGEELSQEDWARFDAAVAEVKAERERAARQMFFAFDDGRRVGTQSPRDA